jgi:hypothetical protein
MCRLLMTRPRSSLVGLRWPMVVRKAEYQEVWMDHRQRWVMRDTHTGYSTAHADVTIWRFSHFWLSTHGIGGHGDGEPKVTVEGITSRIDLSSTDFAPVLMRSRLEPGTLQALRTEAIFVRRCNAAA